MGSECLEAMQNLGINLPVLVLGLPDEFPPHGDPQVIRALCGLDVESVNKKCIAFVNEANSSLRA